MKRRIFQIVAVLLVVLCVLGSPPTAQAADTITIDNDS